MYPYAGKITDLSNGLSSRRRNIAKVAPVVGGGICGLPRRRIAAIADAIEYAESVDFDGTNDYLSRDSDLTGNADGKVFTFSAWVWLGSTSETIYDNTGNRFTISVSSGALTIIGKNSSGTTILSASVANVLPINTFIHLLISIDLANASNRYVYINDSTASVTWTTYTNDSIDFTAVRHDVGSVVSGGNPALIRISELFLDYTYRDLSVEANRRLFITSDRKPASGQASLAPILYLPFDDPTTCYINRGTGGNFTLNGTVARSGRGANQFNAAYSDFDGSADYLNSSSVTGIADGKQVTFNCIFNTDTIAVNEWIFAIYSGMSKFEVLLESNMIRVRARDVGGSDVLDWTYTGFSAYRNYIFTFSFDLSDTGKRHAYLNGSSISGTWSTYSNTNIDLTTSDYSVGGRSTTPTWNGRIGNLFFHASYIDLSNSANLAKFVTGTGIDAKPVDLGADGSTPLGVQPLIYLPMYGNNAGKNYGSGGDFTVNSGPYTGARGPSEFWGNKADFDGATGYLEKSSQLTSISDSKTFSFSFWFNVDATAGAIFATFTTPGSGTSVNMSTADVGGLVRLDFEMTNSAGTVILSSTCNLQIGTTTNAHVCGMVDLSNTSNRGIYVDGVSKSVTWSTYTDDSIDFTRDYSRIGRSNGSTYENGRLYEFYFTTEYIDFSLESNRLKFRDAFGNPVDIGTDGATPTGTPPAIYMRFDPSSQGTNSGTGGDFTKSGTINDGGQL